MLRRRTHRVLSGAGAILGSAIAAGLVTSGTLAAFYAKTGDNGNNVSAKADWVGPNVTAVLASKGSGSAGYLRPGGTYRVYASVPSDSGNPPSGTKTVKADVSSLTTGTTAASLTSGSYALNGVTYNYRSASLTVDAAAAEGARTFSLTATDNLTNTTLRSGLPVVVDATPPSTVDVQTANASHGTVGRAETGDTMTFTFGENVEPATILAGWDGSALATTVRLNNNAGGDRILIYNAANSTQTKLGTAILGGTAYTTANLTFTNSTMVLSGSAPWTVTVTLGTPSGAVTTQAASTTMSWTPLAAITDLAGNAIDTTARSESGAADVEF